MKMTYDLSLSSIRQILGESFPSNGLIHAWTFETTEVGMWPWPDQVGSVDMLSSGDVSPVLESSKNGNGLRTGDPDLTSVSQTSVGSGKDLGALNFDHSLSLWFKMDTWPDTARFFVVSSDVGLLVGRNAGILTYDDTIEPTVNGANAAALGVWHNLIDVYDQASGIHTFYLDGVLDATVTEQYTADPGGSIAIGNTEGTAGATLHWDEIYMWSRKLNATEISVLQTTFYTP